MLLSICIPSYNRIHKIYPVISSLLSLKSNDFEIVVVDNCSTQDLSPLLSINDKRLRLIQRETPVYGTQSVSECLKYGMGCYSMLCLDKDWVDACYLNDFLECLKQHQEIVGGICTQNKKENNFNIQIVKKDPIIKFGYLNKHPSGSFYKTEVLKKIFNDIQKWEIMDPFCYDLITSKCATYGPMMNYDKKLIFLETIEDSLNIRSLSFKKETKTLFFYPQNRIEEYSRQVEHLSSLPIKKNVKTKVSKIIYKRTVSAVSFSYSYIMKTKWICDHYNIETRKVSVSDMRGNISKLNSCFLQKENNLNKFYKYLLMSYCYLKFNAKVFLHKI